ncbi:unnamed protein product, partial [Discosporangium mesarthrocarpum]
ICVPRHLGLQEVRTQLCLLKMVWDMVSLVDSLFGSWMTTLWADIKTDELLDEVKSLQQQIRKLPRRVRDWEAYADVEDRVVNMSTVLPLVSKSKPPS